jgi:hypothetical protein
MQLLCGVAGPDARARPIFDGLLASSRQSNGGLALTVDSAPGLRLGYAARRFASWSGADPALRLFLDGEILFVDGQPTSQLGTSASELAQVARLYRRHGADLWRRLDGNFCLIIQDGPLLRIGVDPAGTRSVYWWVWDGVLAFHTHLLDLAPWFPGRLEEDAGAIGNLLASGCYPPGATAYRDVHHLRPGFHLAFDAGSARVDRHFHLVSHAREDGATADAKAQELGVLLAESVGATWKAAQRPVFPLSGGIDSRYIVAEAARHAGDLRLVRTITWGEDRGRADSDAVIAARVAATLGVENVWCEQTQTRLETSWERALYLSSGEADHAIHYHDDHLLHRQLAEMGYASLFRGDECIGLNGVIPVTRHSLLVTVDVHHLSFEDGTYRRFLDGDALREMVRGQTQVLATILEGLQSPTPAGCSGELYYDFRLSQVLAVYNRVKHADLEVYNPMLPRPLLEWAGRLPDRFRVHPVPEWAGRASDPFPVDRQLLFEAMRQNFPELARLPYATVDNLPHWEERFQRDPRFARFYADICSAPGWLDGHGNKRAVIDALRAMERRATERGPEAPVDVPVDVPDRRPALRQALRTLDSWKESAKQTQSGRLLHDVVRERRMAAKQPLYLKLGRLATLHALLGQVDSRRAAPPGA